MKKVILLLVLIGIAALVLQFLKILGGILLIIIGITSLLIAVVLWLVSLIK